MGTWGRPPTCICGLCAKCKRAASFRAWYRALSPEQRREWRARRDPERVRAHDKARYEASKRDPNSPDQRRRRAHAAVKKALTKGELVKGPCEGCGATEGVQGHHDDYDEPLVVKWVCTICHAAEHNPKARTA